MRTPRPARPSSRAATVLSCLLASLATLAHPLGEPYNDAALGQAAAARLGRDPYLRRLPIRVEVRAGVARLEGNVETLAQAEAARRAVAQVRGLVEIDSADLAVAAEAALDDRRLRGDLESAFGRIPALKGLALHVRVEQGVGHLEGSVGTAAQRRLVLDAARGVRGLRGIDLRVEPREGSQDDDAKLEGQLRGLLADRMRFPIQGRVAVRVRDRIAILEGSVQRVIDRLDAEEVAWYAGGVRGVQNMLMVVPRPRLRRLPPGSSGQTGVPPAVRTPQGDPETPDPPAPEDDSDGTL